MSDAASAQPPEVTDLRLVALTPERGHLVLEDSDSRQFRVPVDERLAAALRTPDRSRPGQVEIALESQLTPREIQARVRAGQSLEEVTAAAGIAVDRVERYAAPVLAERAHVVEQAQRAPARRATAGTAPALAQLVDARLAEQTVAADSVTWDAWRGDDDRWTVRLSYLGGGRARRRHLGVRPARPGARTRRRRGPVAGRRHRRRPGRRRPAGRRTPVGCGAARPR